MPVSLAARLTESAGGQRRQHVRGRGRGGGDRRALGVERHGDGAGVQVERRRAGSAAAPAVDRIAQHRAAERGEVHAQLMRAPGARLQLEPGQALASPSTR